MAGGWYEESRTDVRSVSSVKLPWLREAGQATKGDGLSHCGRIAGYYETAPRFAGDIRGCAGCRLSTQVRAGHGGLGPLLVGRQTGAADQIRRHGRSPDHEHQQPRVAGEGRREG